MTRSQNRPTPGRGATPSVDSTPAAATLASLIGADWSGPNTTVDGIDALGAAGPDDLAFCTAEDPEAVRESDAGVVVCPPSVGGIDGRTLVYADRPRTAFARITDAWRREESEGTTIHPSATVAPDATVGAGCRVGAGAYVDACVTLGDGCTVGPGAVLGTPGFGYARGADDELTQLVHEGSVVIGEDASVGANTTVDRGVFGRTVVGRGTKVSANVHLAHQVELGEDVTVAFGAGFAGGATVGDRTTVHPHVSVATDVTVGADAELGMNAAVLSDVPAGTRVVGSPAEPVAGAR